ncbi:MAG: roadblock/LC7 domain-containing protein [Chloroflexota bacterium]
MYPARSLDHEEIEFALAYLTGALPCKVSGVTLMTLEGELIGQCLVRYDNHRLATLHSIAHTLASQMAADLGTGDFRYNFHVCANGVTLTLLLQERYLVCISARDVRSLDDMLAAVHEGILPLKDVLGIGRP